MRHVLELLASGYGLVEGLGARPDGNDLAEHHGLVVVHDHAVFEVTSHATRKYVALDVAAPGHHVPC